MRKNTAKTIGCSFLILLSLSLSFGCATKNRSVSDSIATGYGSDSEQVNRRVRDYLEANDDESSTSPRGQAVLMRTARAALGTPYVRGGTSTDGFDCSGFVQWTFNKVGVKLPRTAREQSRVGRAIRNLDDMQVGDIVAFRHPKRGYHTGIYVGDGKFIHSPRKRTTVRINALTDPYFSGTFLGARRVNVSNEEEIAAAEKMLAEYRGQEKRRAVERNTDKRKKNMTADRSSKRKGTQSVAGASQKKNSDVKKSSTKSNSKEKSSTKASSSKNKQDTSKAKSNTQKNKSQKTKDKSQASSKGKNKSTEKNSKQANTKPDTSSKKKTASRS